MLIAAAGPASNLVLAALAAVSFCSVLASIRVCPGRCSTSAGSRFNLKSLLAVFNMLPVPPLDGGNVLSGCCAARPPPYSTGIRPYGFLVLYALMLTGFLWAIVDPVRDAILRVLL